MCGNGDGPLCSRIWAFWAGVALFGACSNPSSRSGTMNAVDSSATSADEVISFG